MFARLSQSPPAPGADVIARAIGALALMALAVIHVVDLPATLGPDRAGRHRVSRDHRRGARRRRGADRPVALAGLGGRRCRGRLAMGGYVLTRALPGGFLGDHGDVGNWRCPLGIAALSVETLIILLVVLAAWLGRLPAASVAAESRPAARRAPEYSQPR